MCVCVRARVRERFFFFFLQLRFLVTDLRQTFIKRASSTSTLFTDRLYSNNSPYCFINIGCVYLFSPFTPLFAYFSTFICVACVKKPFPVRSPLPPVKVGLKPGLHEKSSRNSLRNSESAYIYACGFGTSQPVVLSVLASVSGLVDLRFAGSASLYKLLSLYQCAKFFPRLC